MMWNVLNLVLVLVLLMYCLPTAVSEECNETEIIVGRLGEELMLKFSLSDLRHEYTNETSTERNQIQIQDLIRESYISKRKMHSKEVTIYKNGNPTEWVGNQTEIFITDDALVVKKTKLQKEDAGIYWIEFRATRLGQKALIISGKPTIKERSPPNPVLKPEDNYTSTIQLECHSVSTSIGDCPLSMYTVWYKNGMEMTDLDSSLSQINVTVDHNGGNFTCRVTDYLPCYQRLQTTNHDDVLKIEECNNVFESETFILQPEYPPIDVKLEPDQRKIIVNRHEDLKVRCSAKCHPECEVTWEKDVQILKSSGSVFIIETVLGTYLKIVNINSSHEGVYVCLVKNIHGENKMDFTLSVTETEEKVVNGVDNRGGVIVGIVTPVIIVAVIVIIIIVIKCRKCRNKDKNTPDGNKLSADGAEQEAMLEENGKPEASTDNNSKNGD